MKHLAEHESFFDGHPETSVRLRGLFLIREIEQLRLALARHNIDPGLNLSPMTLEEMCGHYCRATVDQCGGNIKAAALLLGIHRTRIYRLLRVTDQGDVTCRGSRDGAGSQVTGPVTETGAASQPKTPPP